MEIWGYLRWEFPKIKGTILGVPKIRTIVLRGILGSPYFGKLPGSIEMYRGCIRNRSRVPFKRTVATVQVFGGSAGSLLALQTCQSHSWVLFA